MSAKENSKRVFIIAIVAVFFLTSLGTTGLVVYDAVKNKDNKQSADSQTEQQSQEGKLEGTKLAGYTPVQSVAQLQSTDLTVGTGATVAQNATITAHYTGALAKDGTIFQSSKDTGQPFTSELSGLIPGWQQGIPGMKVGGVRRLVIPAAQAYGAQEQQGIPANSDLVFDIELLDTK